MSLSIILATRGRPHLLLPTIERTVANIRHPDTKIVVAVDEDDIATREAIDDSDPTLAKHCITSVMPREDSLGEKYNDRMGVAQADVYLVMVDYAPHVTPGFDRRLLDTAAIFPDQIGIIYNRMANGSFPGINAVTHKLAEMMGGIYPPYFPFWFVDHWLDDIGRLTDRIAFCDVEIDTSRRPGTMEAREPYWWATFFDALWPERVAIARKIIDALDEPAWRKRLLKERAPWVWKRSVNINDNLRAMPWAHQAGPVADARYARIKRRATEHVRPYVLAFQEAERRAGAA